jgi:tetratricopeptide (TPR) repeat protein
MSNSPMHTIPGAFQKLQALYAEGEAAIQEQRFADAVARFSEGLRIDDNFRQRYVTMYAQRAFALHNLGRLEEAIPDYTRAIEKEPEINQAQYYFQRGLCFMSLGRPDDAIADYGQAIALHPHHPGPFHLRGKLLFQQGRFADAIRDFDSALAIHDIAECRELKQQAQAQLQATRLDQASRAHQAVATGNAGDADPVVFPGQRVAKLSDYVRMMKHMQTGDMQGALGAFGLDMMGYAQVAQAWGTKLAQDPVLNAKFAAMMSR